MKKNSSGSFMFKYSVFLVASHSLFALTTLQVSSSVDDDAGGFGNPGDLRFCLNTMNQQLNGGSIDDYAIVFDFPMTIQLNGNLPIVNTSTAFVNITIGNPGSIPTVTIDGNSGAYSGFFISTGNVTIQNMILQNLTARGGNGGDGISGGGGGMGAGGAIYAPQFFLNASTPSITLLNVAINDCAAIGGNGGNYSSTASTGNEGGGGGGGFGGNGGSVTATGSSGGGGGGGFGGDGGDATVSINDINGGGGGGGGGLGSRASTGDLGNGGSDQSNGQDGNGYGLNSAGFGGAGLGAGANGGGGGGGGDIGGFSPGGGGGGSSEGTNGNQAQGNIPPGGGAMPSGGSGNDGGGGGGGGVVISSFSNGIDGQAGSGGYGGGGGGGAGTGSYDAGYAVRGGSGGVGGGGGGGGVNQSDVTPAEGGNSLGGGGGGGGGPSNSITSIALGGTDTGNLGGGAGGAGATTISTGFGGGGGGGGSGLGGAIFMDSGVNLTIQAFPGIPTIFNTTNTTTQSGMGGSAGSGGENGFPGSALGNSIFLRSGASLMLVAQEASDLLTLGDQVAFVDDTNFGAGGTGVYVRGNGTVVYNGTTDYQGSIHINNTNFKVNGLINTAPISVCRNMSAGAQRGTLSGSGTLTGDVFVNSGTISPDTGETLTLGSLYLNSAGLGSLGSLVHIEIDSSSTPSTVAVIGTATLAGILEMTIDPNASPGTYTLLTSTGITGTFDSVVFTGPTPNYKLSYLPIGSPTFVQFEFLGYPPSNVLKPPSHLQGRQVKNSFPLEVEFFNQLRWQPSPSRGVKGYFIYRDGKKIGKVDASTHTYQDHNKQQGVVYEYAVTAFNSKGSESSPISIIIK